MRIISASILACCAGTMLLAPATFLLGDKTVAMAQVPRAEVDAIIATIDKIVKFRSYSTRTVSSSSPSMDEAKAELDRFRAEVEAEITPSLVASANDPSERRLVSLKARANRFAETYERELAAVDFEQFKGLTREGTIFTRYIGLVASREKLALLRRIYGDTPEIAAATGASDRAFAGLGDFAAVEGQATEAKKARIAQARMQPAVRTDAALSAQFARAYEASVYNTEKATVAKVNLISNGWSVERNEITGIILLRYQYASLGLKTPDGNCHTAQARFEQKHQGGGSYGGTYYRSGAPQEMLCENM